MAAVALSLLLLNKWPQTLSVRAGVAKSPAAATTSRPAAISAEAGLRRRAWKVIFGSFRFFTASRQRSEIE